MKSAPTTRSTTKTQDFVDEVKRITGGRGADVVLDMVAGDYVAREVQCLADEGRIVIIAVQGGVKSEFDAGDVLRERLTITGSTLRPRPGGLQGRRRGTRCVPRCGR